MQLVKGYPQLKELQLDLLIEFKGAGIRRLLGDPFFWWKILEKICKIYGDTNDFLAIFSWPFWPSYLKCNRNNLQAFFDQKGGQVLP